MKEIKPLTSRRSIGSILDQNRGLGPGFDFLRVALALSVVVWHAIPVANGGRWLDLTRVVWLPGYVILAMFFALSGFLIAGSALRLSLRDFLINRGLRIFPALILEILLSAIVLGVWFSNLPARQYFTKRQTYHYLTNIIGFMQYRLPGVFENNPSHLVNWSLWTVPYELVCYGIMSGFIVYGLLKRPKVLLWMAASYAALGLLITFLAPDLPQFLIDPLDSAVTGRGSRLLLAFTLGIAAFLYRHRIPYSWKLFGLSTAICIAVSLIRPAPWLTYPIMNALLCLPMVYMTVFIGATRIPKLPIYGRGDYSYGIYLYGLPIQQAVRATLPFTTTGLLNLLFSVPLITLFAMLSWHQVEERILKKRHHFGFVGRTK